jgi:hypothetical protein
MTTSVVADEAGTCARSSIATLAYAAVIEISPATCGRSSVWHPVCRRHLEEMLRADREEEGRGRRRKAVGTERCATAGVEEVWRKRE